jgi:Type II secretion system (T2SS), protein M subtype b
MRLRRRRMLFIGIGIVTSWTSLKALPWLVTEWGEARWEVQDQARLLAQHRIEIANEQALAHSAAQVKEAMIALAPRLLAGETSAQAGDALAALLSVVATRSNTKLTSSLPMADSTEAGHLRRVAIHAAFDGDIRGVTSMLRSLSEEETVLIADELRILAADAGGSEGGAEVLRVELTVRGWYLSEKPISGR